MRTPIRVFMIIETSDYLRRVEGNQFSIFTQKFHNSVSKTIKQFNGSIEKSDNNSYWLWFESVTDAVLCALQIQYKFKYVTPKNESFKRRLNVALAVSNSEDKVALSEEAIKKLAIRMCEVVQGELVFSSEVVAQYEIENKNAKIDKQLVRVLSVSEASFLTQVMDYIEMNWQDASFSVSKWGSELGIGKSRLYRTMMRLTGKSPSHFIREFRLHEALSALHDRSGTITEIAKSSGFMSPSYFSKCFFEKYGILPSKYVQQHVN